MTLSLPIDPAATKLLYDSPLALLLGMLLDQQIPMEKAFSSPYVLRQRLGHDLDAHEIASFDPVALEAIFAQPPGERKRRSSSSPSAAFHTRRRAALSRPRTAKAPCTGPV